MQKFISKNNSDFIYYKKGNSPVLLIHSGTHGDESEVNELVMLCVEKYGSVLPPFIYVPCVSPSAVKNKTRINNNKADINRIFYSNSLDPEVQENIKILEQGPFDLLVTFHEDPESSEYYIYDCGYNEKETALIIAHNQKLERNGYSLLNGLDDPADPDLGNEFVNGYRKFCSTEGEKDSGMILSWALNRNIVKDGYIPEIPGKISISEKSFIVETFFTDVIIPYFN